MKIKVSISIDEEILERVKERVEIGAFRSNSHFIEFATKQLLEEKK